MKNYLKIYEIHRIHAFAKWKKKENIFTCLSYRARQVSTAREYQLYDWNYRYRSTYNYRVARYYRFCDHRIVFSRVNEYLVVPTLYVKAAVFDFDRLFPGKRIWRRKEGKNMFKIRTRVRVFRTFSTSTPSEKKRSDTTGVCNHPPVINYPVWYRIM